MGDSFHYGSLAPTFIIIPNSFGENPSNLDQHDFSTMYSFHTKNYLYFNPRRHVEAVGRNWTEADVLSM
jgi:hypothetical protein